MLAYSAMYSFVMYSRFPRQKDSLEKSNQDRKRKAL
jgi:hypothetical protein